jgi:hypothetical protein
MSNKTQRGAYVHGAKTKEGLGKGKRSVLLLVPGGQPDVFAARTRDPPALLLRDDLNPLHHAKGMLCLTETEWGCLRLVLDLRSIYG